MRHLFFSLCLLCVADAAAAQDCTKASSQADMNICADNALRKADGELNTLYGQIRARLTDDAARSALLTTAQRAWVAHRDAECAFAASAVEGGSAYPMIAAQCRTNLTEKRNEDFRLYLACAEGDLSCPVPAGD